MHARMEYLCLDPGRGMFDAHFILVYPWWLHNEAIKTFLGPLKTKILPFIGMVQVRFVKILIFCFFR